MEIAAGSLSKKPVRDKRLKRGRITHTDYTRSYGNPKRRVNIVTLPDPRHVFVASFILFFFFFTNGLKSNSLEHYDF